MLKSMPGEANRAHTKEKVRNLLTIIGKPHTLTILSFFAHEAHDGARFNEMCKQLDLAPNTLSRRLKELQASGLVSRHPVNQVPPRVDYRPTQATLALGSVLRPLHEWLDYHADDLI